jgi:multidrug efflux pump subunit AcrA (membrane-fusion protein)
MNLRIRPATPNQHRQQRAIGYRLSAIGYILWLLALAGLLLSGCAGLGGQSTAPTATPDAAPEPPRVVADGKVLPISSVDLRFLSPSLVGEIMVAEGDQVAAGAPMARLDSAELRLGVDQACAALTHAQAAYAQLAAGAAPDTIAAAEAGVAQAQASARQVFGSVSPSDVTAAEASLAQARAELARLLAGPKADQITQARAALAQAQADLQTQRDALSAAKGQANLRLTQAANALSDAQDAYSQLYWANREAEQSDEKLTQAQKDAEQGARRAVDSAQAALGQAQLALENARQAEQSGIASAQSRVSQAQASLDMLLAGADADVIAGARARVAAAGAELARLTGEVRAGQVGAANAAVQQARANLSQLQSGPRDVDLAVAAAQVQSAEVAVRQAELALDRATLRAPFAGTVVAINLTVGETPPTEPAIVFADTSAWKIETNDLTEIDVVNVKPGDQVTLSFDALPDLALTGSVTEIKGLGTTYQGDVTYTVVIKPNNWDPRLRWNMTATVTIGA